VPRNFVHHIYIYIYILHIYIYICNILCVSGSLHRMGRKTPWTGGRQVLHSVGSTEVPVDGIRDHCHMSFMVISDVYKRQCCGFIKTSSCNYKYIAIRTLARRLLAYSVQGERVRMRLLSQQFTRITYWQLNTNIFVSKYVI
jgi:hypothetical protein